MNGGNFDLLTFRFILLYNRRNILFSAISFAVERTFVKCDTNLFDERRFAKHSINTATIARQNVVFCNVNNYLQRTIALTLGSSLFVGLKVLTKVLLHCG